MTPGEVDSVRSRLWTCGFRPVPILNAGHADKARAGKAPLGANWTDLARHDPPDCLRYQPVGHAMNTGILCDGLQAFDFDIDDPELAGRCRALVIGRVGEPPLRFRANSSRCLLLCRAAEGEPRKISIAGKLGKIEILGRGQQFVAHGFHPSGVPLDWHPDPPWLVPREQLPAVTEEQVRALLTELAPLIEAEPPARSNGQDQAPGEPQADALRIAAALQAIPNDGPPDWEWWNRVGMAVWRATGGSNLGFEALNHWSRRNPAYSAQETKTRWDHYTTSPPTQIGAGTLFHMAAEARKAAPPPDAPERPAQDDVQFVQAPITPITQIMPRQWAYGRFMLFGSAAVIGALDGTGKGYIAVGIMLALITGRHDILSEKVWRKGPVAIVTYEDGIEEWQRRFAAACLKHSLDYETVMQSVHFIIKPGGRVVFAQNSQGGVIFPDTNSIARQLKAGGFVLLLIDPFNNAHAMEDGNNNVAIAAVAAEMSRIARVADVAVLVLHHLRKGARGDPDDLMGALMLRANFRSCRILQKMTTDEAGKLRLPAKEAWRYIRISGTKENYSVPADKATWFKLETVHLNNGADIYPDGDAMGTAISWEPPAMFEGMNAFELHAVFAAIDAKPHARAKQATIIPWIGRPLLDVGNRTEDQATKIVAAWTKSGVLVPGDPHKATNRNEIQTLVTNQSKVAEILHFHPVEAHGA